MKYDVFLFDADDTLYEFKPSSAYALRTMFERCGFAYSDSVQARYFEINAQAWASYEKGEISVDELQRVRFAHLFEEIGVSWDAEDFNTRYLYEFGKGAFLLEGALDICREIAAKGKEIYIITNGLAATQDARAKYSPLREYISGVFISQEIGHQKPEREFFDYVLAHIPAVRRDKMLVIGDSLTADIAGGNGAGIDTCWLNVHGVENRTGIVPVYEIRELAQLRQFI